MGKIDPYTSYKSVFTTSQNKEMIFSYLEDGGGIDKRLAPNSNGGWGGGYNPTQEIVDAYAMAETGRFPITGYTNEDRTTPVIDPEAGYKEAGYSQFTNPCEGKEREKTYNMFVGREPRFYVSIVYGGMSWFIQRKQVREFSWRCIRMEIMVRMLLITTLQQDITWQNWLCRNMKPAQRRT